MTQALTIDDSDVYHKKQVSYPDIFMRLMSTMIDTIIIALVMSPVTLLLSFYGFKVIFADYITSEHLVLTGIHSFQELLVSEAFVSNATISLSQHATFYCYNLFLTIFLYGVYFITFWHRYSTTIGKFILRMKVVDIATLKKPSIGKLFARYIGACFYPISIIAMFFGNKRLTIHDRIAHTVVIKL